ncbi:hypothetical protein [Bacillus vallismortis]|uniref:hypothetical protein n=1 Tax=Bacillus vallismortis TaxID=72361 RepID=UPI000EF4C2A8|nr:hypothetical protein [Bacillus vallismortis]MCI4138138.1 hypothetical protein [Bacillus vallismortis]MCY8424042.1 hypothetical protein [Bacillus vallismortis]
MKSIEDYTLLSAYYHLLFTIEEGLCYLIEAEQNLSKTEGDRIYQDLIQAFFYLDSSHSTLLFIMNTGCAECSIKAFDEIFAEFDQLVSFSFPSHEFFEYLKEHFLIRYRQWMLSIHQCMEPFVIN